MCGIRSKTHLQRMMPSLRLSANVPSLRLHPVISSIQICAVSAGRGEGKERTVAAVDNRRGRRKDSAEIQAACTASGDSAYIQHRIAARISRTHASRSTALPTSEEDILNALGNVRSFVLLALRVTLQSSRFVTKSNSRFSAGGAFKEVLESGASSAARRARRMQLPASSSSSDFFE